MQISVCQVDQSAYTISGIRKEQNDGVVARGRYAGIFDYELQLLGGNRSILSGISQRFSADEIGCR